MSNKHRIIITVPDSVLNHIIEYNLSRFDPPLPLATVFLSLMRRGLIYELVSDALPSQEKK